MSDLSKNGGGVRTNNADTDQIASLVEDVSSDSILDALLDIKEELKLQTELLKGLLR